MINWWMLILKLRYLFNIVSLGHINTLIPFYILRLKKTSIKKVAQIVLIWPAKVI